jgi:hypothetical protein
MIGIPCRTHIFTLSALRAWEQARTPRLRASVTAAETSSSVIGVWVAGTPAISSPDMFSLIRSTPYLMNSRTLPRIPSGPLAIAPKDSPSCPMCGGVVSPRPPGTVISCPFAR